MDKQLKEKINRYWTGRVQGYNEVNQEEFAGIQHKAWQREISATIKESFRESQKRY